MLLTRWIAALLMVCFPSIGLAQWPSQCRSDISRQCQQVKNDGDRTILTCLQTNAKTLRPACRKLLESYGHLKGTWSIK
jgi:hypothetical protein